MEWSLGAEYWSGVESDFRVAKVEWSAVVMYVCVCVTDPLLLQEYIKLGHSHTSQLHSILLLPLQNLTSLHSKTSLHRIHNFCPRKIMYSTSGVLEWSPLITFANIL